MPNPNSPEVLFQAATDGLHFAVIRRAGSLWRLGSIAEEWQKPLAGLEWPPAPAQLKELAAAGIWLAPADGANLPPLAVMCCGLGSIWPGMGRDLYANFPVAAAAMDRVAQLAHWDLLGLMDEAGLDKISQTRWQIPYLFMLEYAQWSLLSALGLRPSIFCGHSLGELIALCLAGVYSLEAAWYLLETRSEHMAELEAKPARRGGMLAVPAGYGEIAAVLDQWPGLRIANRNTERQYILGGSREELMDARRHLRRKRIPAIMLNIDLAFHNPAMRILRDMSLRRLNGLSMRKPDCPVLSCVDGQPYPERKPDICTRIADLDENAVDWVNLVEKAESRCPGTVFLELGPQETLCGLTSELLPAAVCLSADRKGHEASAMREICARMFSMGFLEPSAIARQASGPVAPGMAYRVADAPVSDARAALDDIPEEERQIVRELVAEAAGVPVAEIMPDMDLRHDLAVRSSHFPFLMLEAERRLGRPVVLENLFRIITVADLVRFLTGAGDKGLPHPLPQAAPRQLFTRLRKPPQRYSLPGGVLEPLPLDPGNRGLPLQAGSRMAAIIGDKPLKEKLLRGFRAIGCDVIVANGQDMATTDIDGLVFCPAAFAPGSAEDIPAFSDTVARRFSGLKWICVLQRFVAGDAPERYLPALRRWHQETAAALGKAAERVRLVAWLDSVEPDQNGEFCGDLLVMELLYGAERDSLWVRSPDLPRQLVFCPASAIYGRVFPDAALEASNEGNAFHGFCHFSLFANPNLASHGKGALFSPLAQFVPPEPDTAAPWLTLSCLLDSALDCAAARLPMLSPIGIADLRVFRLPSLPEGITRECRVSVTAPVSLELEGILTRPCQVNFDLLDISANGRKTGASSPMTDCRVLLASGSAPLHPLWHVESRPEELCRLPELLYEALGFGDCWRTLRDARVYVNEGGGKVWEAGMASEAADSSRGMAVFCRIADAALQGAMASIAEGAATAPELAAALRQWRFSFVGFIRFDPTARPVELAKIKLQWRKSWHDDFLVRYDAQAFLDGKVILTIQNLEFECIRSLERPSENI